MITHAAQGTRDRITKAQPSTREDSSPGRALSYPAAGLSLGAALIHLWVAPEHFSEWWGYGVFFLLVALVQGLFGAALLRWPNRKALLLAGIEGNLALISFYVMTRTSGIPLGPHAGEVHAVGTLDLLCVGAELSLVVALVALAGGFAAARAHMVNLWRPRTATALAGAFAAVAMLGAPAVGGLNLFGQGFSLLGEAQAQSAPAACNVATYDRTYNVEAINVEIPFNRYSKLQKGADEETTVAENINEHGQVFVLKDDETAVDNWYVPLGQNPDGTPNPNDDNRRLRPRPLVIRANAGECVKVTLTNKLDAQGHDGLPNDPRVSMRINGVAYDARTSDGSMVGFNPDTTAGIGEKVEYYWKAPQEEGLYFFRDEGATAGSEADGGSIAHGLYGALAVEPAGSRWLDPETGKPLYNAKADANGKPVHDSITKQSGDPYIDADIVPAVGRAFRETVQISQDEIPGGIGMGFNYGSEPQHNREANPVPDGLGEETSLSSWTYGDPSLIKLASGFGPWLPQDDPNNPGNKTSPEDCGLEQQPGGSCYVSNVTHAYPGDPTKIRFAHAGPKETHVFHMHAHQWLSEPNDPKSNVIDSQTYGPGETYTADLIAGAGSNPRTIGDSIFHCHLYPHFANGFWSLFRVHDVLENGTTKLPDGTNVRALKPLPGNAAPGAPTANNPGYPRFIPGKFGWRAPQPPDSVSEPSGAADNPSTLKREDLKPAQRIVAGATIPAAKLALEKGVQNLNYGGTAPKPGAPLTDPCPTGARQVTYNVSVMQRDVVYNEDGWHDTQARFLVLDKDVPRMLEKNPDGTYKNQPEPLFFRANAGDCINFNFTNRLPNWVGNDAFQQAIQTNMAGQHIHLVKFDVLASDGSSNGWNYQEAAFTQDQMNFNKSVLGGKQTCDATTGCRIESPPAGFDFNRGTTPTTVGQTITERWYADSELNTVFSHDHHFAAVDQNRGWYSGLIVEPKGMDYRNPATGAFYQPGSGSIAGAPICGQACEGTAVGTAMDIIGRGTKDDFREYGLGLQDFALLHKSAAEGGEPINPPDAPETFPDDDPGVMAINMRNAPFKLRETDNTGQPTDPAYVFSSNVHGDPQTPLLEAYTNDPIRMRVIQGSQEEQHVFSINGMRWRKEAGNPNSPLVNSQQIGVSEAFNLQAPAIDCDIKKPELCYADLLYGSSATDDMYLGMWGLMRVRGEKAPTLLPLPDNPVADKVKGDPVPKKKASAKRPPAVRPFNASNPGQPCLPGSPTRSFNVVAMQADLQYNKYGDHDPFGLIYALSKPGETPEQTVARVRAEDRHEPLVLRANEGDCVQVKLTNKLTPEWLQGHGNAGTNGDPTLPLETATGTPAGLRVSLHPQLVSYDPRGSDGATVGFNPDQTVGPGESKMYRWYADDAGAGELGATNLLDFGDVRGHRHHGLFAGLNIEPAGSTYHDPLTGAQIESGASADIHVPGLGNDFREFTTFFQDGLNLRDSSGAIIEDPFDHPPAPGEPAATLDAEDQGEKGFNYANAPYSNRLGFEPITTTNTMVGAYLAHVFSSTAHGDPDTPIFRAYAGDRIRMRVLQGSDKPRQNTFQLSGANWKAQPNDPRSTLIGAQGAISVARAENVHLNDGSGGEGALFPGDYRYGNGVLFHHLSGGQWGIMRIYQQPAASSAPTALGEQDSPYAAGHPIMPLEP